jgi:three-Cys-motif partner protein
MAKCGIKCLRVIPEGTVFELAPPEPDGLYTPQVGSWSSHKHHFPQRYIDIFTTGMKHKPWGGGLHYVDLFAGAGVEDVEGIGLQWGSPLIAAQATNRFARLHLGDVSGRTFAALKARVERIPQPQSPQLLQGDVNALVGQVVAAIPPKGTLSLAFLDPYGLHLSFDTLRCLAQRRTDSIIFFPDSVDAIRNWKIYLDKADSNLDRVIGNPTWREIHNVSSPHSWASKLREVYVEQIKTLGYGFFDFERIARPDGVFLYQLIFCTRHSRGAEFWRKIATKKPGGQRSFDFP